MLRITERHCSTDPAVPKQTVGVWRRTNRGCPQAKVVSHTKTDRRTKNDRVRTLRERCCREFERRWIHDLMAIAFTTRTEHTKQLG